MKSSFTEWLSQTRRINKEIDTICMDTIDSIIRVLKYLDRKVIYQNKTFFDKFCNYYHKPNPVALMRKIRVKDMARCTKCVTEPNFESVLTQFVQASIDRCWKGIDMVQIQWFEVIDFMYERPELVNPLAIDEYITNKIEEVCRYHKKLNPLENGTAKRFGKFFKNKEGFWTVERRRRF